MTTDEESDLKNGQPLSQSKDKEPLVDIKLGAIRQQKQQGSQWETVADRQGRQLWSHQAEESNSRAPVCYSPLPFLFDQIIAFLPLPLAASSFIT